MAAPTLKGCMTLCGGLRAATHAVQWGHHDVWKVGGKVFAIAGTADDGHFTVSFKVSPMGFEVLRDHPDCRPAPYLASRGMTWIQYYRGDDMTPRELGDLLTASYELIAAGLTKKKRAELGLLEAKK